MGHLSAMKRDWNYESNVPRCAVCIHFKESRIVMTNNSKTVRINHHCTRGGFTCTPNGCCDKWRDKSGCTLEKLPSIPKTIAEQKVNPKVTNNPKKTFECLNCGATFSTEQGRDHHRWMVHPATYPNHKKPTLNKTMCET